ncbi:MAG: hypothetical protein ACOYJS_07000, partial [Acutalibacteraceae bacterium]
TERMLENVLYQANSKRKIDFGLFLNPRRAAAVFASVICLTAALMVLKNLNKISSEVPLKDKEIVTADDAAGSNKNPDTTARDNFTEDSIAPRINEFQIDDKHYIILSENYKADFGFPKNISESDIGEKITTITTSVDKSLIGCDVYFYKPAGSQAVVAVKKADEYTLYKFLAFESYNNNKDKDAADYLNLYGIKTAADIAKIQFIGHTDVAKLNGKLDMISEMTNRADIEKFYNFYSVIKDSSDEYFDKLYNFRKDFDRGSNSGTVTTDEIPPDYLPQNAADTPITKDDGNVGSAEKHATKEVTEPKPATSGAIDMGETSVGGSAGAGALADSVTVRIYNKNGVYYEAEYYPNIGFISRHKVNNDFAEFLKNFIK